MQIFGYIFILVALIFCKDSIALERLNLILAYQNALTYDANFQASKKNNLAQSQLKNQAMAAFLPQIKASLYEGRGITDRTTLNSSQETHQVYDSKNYNVSIRQSIFDKSNFDNYKKTKAIIESSDLDLNIEKINLTGRIVSEYLDVLIFLDFVNFAELQKASITSQLEQAKHRYDSGLGTITEISQAEAALQDLVSSQLAWNNSLETAKRTLEKSTGIYPREFEVLDFDKFSKRNFKLGKLEEWVALGNENSSVIKKAQKELDIAEAEVSRIYSGNLPTLDLVMSQAKTQSDTNNTIGSKFDTTSMGLQLNIPLFSGGYTTSKADQTAAQRDEMFEKFKEANRNVELNIRKYFNEMNSNLAKIESLKSSKNAYKEVLTGTKKGYLAGINSNTDVLNALGKFYMAQRDLTREHYMLIQSAVQLKQWVGILDEPDIKVLNADLTPRPSFIAN